MSYKWNFSSLKKFSKMKNFVLTFPQYVLTLQYDSNGD